MKITVTEISAKKMPYPTWDNWYWDKKGDLYIEILKGLSPEEFQLMAIHAQVEAILCRNHGVTDKAVTNFDVAFEKLKKQGEPGDSLLSPYHREHGIATAVERMMVVEMDMVWGKYDLGLDEAFDNAFKGK